MTAHAKLGASSSAIWLACAAAPRLWETVPEEPSSPHAELGTQAHEQAAFMLEHDGDGPFPHLAEDVRPYVDLIESMVGHNDALYVEQRVEYTDWVKEGFGTADAIILHVDGSATICDLKFGTGVKVYAKDNSQLRLYALGVIQMFRPLLTLTKIRMVICQPRLDHVTEETLTVAELDEWGEWVAMRAASTEAADAQFMPGDKQCRWCKARRVCKARALWALQNVEGEALTPAHVAQMLPWADRASAWAKDISAEAMRLLNQGVDLPGYKLVEGRSVRKFRDDAETVLREAGLEEYEIYRQDLRSIGEIEKALGGKKKAAPILERATTKPVGTPTIATKDDPRPALSATVDFPQGE